jgi:hypothetical protein
VLLDSLNSISERVLRFAQNDKQQQIRWGDKQKANAKATTTAIGQSFRLCLHSGLRQSGGRFAALFRRGAEAPLYLKQRQQQQQRQQQLQGFFPFGFAQCQNDDIEQGRRKTRANCKRQLRQQTPTG